MTEDEIKIYQKIAVWRSRATIFLLATLFTFPLLPLILFLPAGMLVEFFHFDDADTAEGIVVVSILGFYLLFVIVPLIVSIVRLGELTGWGGCIVMSLGIPILFPFFALFVLANAWGMAPKDGTGQTAKTILDDLEKWDGLKRWYFYLFYYTEHVPEYLKGAEKVFSIVSFPDASEKSEGKVVTFKYQAGCTVNSFAGQYSDSSLFAEFGKWVCTMADELETIFEPADYLFLLETDFTGQFDVHIVRQLLKKYLPEIEMECETLLLQWKLEYALQLPFLAMIFSITDLWSGGYQKYPLEELGVAPYHDADVCNFLDTYSPHSFSFTPDVDEKTYEDYFPNYREQIKQVIDWLKTGEILIVGEDDNDDQEVKTYHYIDRRKPLAMSSEFSI